MTLVLTVYALLVEHLNIKSAKDVRDKARELRAKAKAAAKKAKAAAKTAKAKLTGRGKKKPFFGEDEDGDDGAVTAQVVTPSGDDEGASLLARKEGWLAAPAPAPAPLVREMPLQQEARVEAPAVHKKHHHHHKKTSPADADLEAPPPPPSDDEEAPPPPPDEDDEEAAAAAASRRRRRRGSAAAAGGGRCPRTGAGDGLDVLVRRRKIHGGRAAGARRPGSQGGRGARRGGREEAGETRRQRRPKAPPKKQPPKKQPPKRAPPKKAPPAKKPDAAPAAKRGWLPSRTAKPQTRRPARAGAGGQSDDALRECQGPARAGARRRRPRRRAPK